MLSIITGHLYTISDQYFIDVDEPYIPKNHPNSHFRPYYLAIYDSSTDLYWMIPLSTKVSKYIKIYTVLYHRWTNSHKPGALKIRDDLMLGIKQVIIGNRDCVLLFQNIIPVSKKYIIRPYYINNSEFSFDSQTTKEIIERAEKVIVLLRNGFKFMDTQPDVNKIESFLLNKEVK